MPADREKLKILQTVCWSGVGGVQEHILQIIQNLDRERFEVQAACPEGYYFKVYSDRNIKTHRVPMRASWDLTSIRQLRKIAVSEGIDIIHAHLGISLMESLLAISGMTRNRPRVVFTEHFINPWRATVSNPVKKWAYAAGHRWADKRVNRYIAVSNAVKQLLVDNDGISPSKVEVIPNGVRVDRYKINAGQRKKIRSEWGIGDGETAIGAIGRFFYEKGFDVFLDAAAMVSKQSRSVKFVLAGDGPLRQPMIQKAGELGLESRVIFPGFVDDIPQTMSAFDIFALPSRHEGLGIVILEAMAMGIPVIATDSGGPREVVRDGETGRLVPVESPDSMARAVLELIADPGLGQQLASRAKSLVEAEYNIIKLMADLGRIYEEVKSGPGGNRA